MPSSERGPREPLGAHRAARDRGTMRDASSVRLMPHLVVRLRQVRQGSADGSLLCRNARVVSRCNVAHVTTHRRESAEAWTMSSLSRRGYRQAHLDPPSVRDARKRRPVSPLTECAATDDRGSDMMPVPVPAARGLVVDQDRAVCARAARASRSAGSAECSASGKCSAGFRIWVASPFSATGQRDPPAPPALLLRASQSASANDGRPRLRLGAAGSTITTRKPNQPTPPMTTRDRDSRSVGDASEVAPSEGLEAVPPHAGALRSTRNCVDVPLGL